MSDVILTIRVPQELVDQINATHFPIETFFIQSVQRELQRERAFDLSKVWHNPPPVLTTPEKEAELAKLLSPERLPEALRLLREGKPILGLFAGKITMSDDFDAELPDEEWGNLFT